MEAMFVCMQITRSRHLADTHNHQLSQLSSRPIEIEHEIEIEMENAIANRDARCEIRNHNHNRIAILNSHRNCGKYAKHSLLTILIYDSTILQFYIVMRA